MLKYFHNRHKLLTFVTNWTLALSFLPLLKAKALTAPKNPWKVFSASDLFCQTLHISWSLFSFCSSRSHFLWTSSISDLKRPRSSEAVIRVFLCSDALLASNSLDSSSCLNSFVYWFISWKWVVWKDGSRFVLFFFNKSEMVYKSIRMF